MEARTMFQVRIHGRGGQGVVTAAELLSVAAFDEGRHAQAFPTFGSERTGAPVVAFCRIDDRADPLPRADRRAGRGDRPGPDAAAPGRPLRRACGADGYLLVNTSQRASRSSGSASSWRRLRPGAAPDGSRHGDRARAPRPAAAERGPARRLRRADRAPSRSTASRPRSRERFPGKIGEANSARGRGGRYAAVAEPRPRRSPMRSQMEGSQAVAQGRRALPAGGDLRLPDLASDAHRRGALRPRAHAASSLRAST